MSNSVMIPIRDLEKQLSFRLSSHRYTHTLSVRNIALKFVAAIKNVDLNNISSEFERIKLQRYQDLLTDEYITKIEYAALLHDYTKELHSGDQLSLAKYYKIDIYEEDRDFPNLLHARVGAEVIQENLDIDDVIIIGAVREHTLGGSNMSLASKITFLADMLEPLRDSKKKSDKLEDLRQIIFMEYDIDKAVIKALDSKIKGSLKKDKLVHPLAVKHRNDFVRNLRKLNINPYESFLVY